MSVNPECDCRPLMKQLAKMANMPDGRIRRMVLVLDVDEIPRLFCESFLGESDEPLMRTELEVQMVKEPIVVNITTMQSRGVGE